MQIAVGHVAVMNDQVGRLKRLETDVYLAGQPNVVLVREENVIALRMFQCILEIAVGPVFARVADYFDSGIAERTDDGKSGVGRTVVGNYKFVLVVQLRKNGIYLFPDIFFTVVGGHADGNHTQ